MSLSFYFLFVKILKIMAEKRLIPMISDPVIKLNVGGTIFETRKSTLTIKLFYYKMHLLEEIFTTGKYYPVETCTDLSFIGPDGTVFIDRDPTYFRPILNYLRDRMSTPSFVSLEPFHDFLEGSRKEYEPMMTKLHKEFVYFKLER
jgi:hypothetical protein